MELPRTATGDGIELSDQREAYDAVVEDNKQLQEYIRVLLDMVEELHACNSLMIEETRKVKFELKSRRENEKKFRGLLEESENAKTKAYLRIRIIVGLVVVLFFFKYVI